MRRILIALCLFATTAAAEEYKRGEIVDGVVTATDPIVNYAYYLPSNYTTDKPWPILYIFDPRSRGVFAAGLFREAAEQYGWILVSSNNTRSDSDTAPNVGALEATIPDAQKRFAVDTGGSGRWIRIHLTIACDSTGTARRERAISTISRR